jgi:hypothetical protein
MFAPGTNRYSVHSQVIHMHISELPQTADVPGNSPAAVDGTPMALYGAAGAGVPGTWFDWSEPSLAA